MPFAELYYQVPVPAFQYLVPQPFYPQPQRGGFRAHGGHWGRGGRRGWGKNPTNQPQQPQQ